MHAVADGFGVQNAVDAIEQVNQLDLTVARTGVGVTDHLQALTVPNANLRPITEKDRSEELV